MSAKQTVSLHWPCCVAIVPCVAMDGDTSRRENSANNLGWFPPCPFAQTPGLMIPDLRLRSL